jgi:hypothetical protein
MEKKNVALGPLTQRLKRTRAPQRRVSLLLSGLNQRTPKRGSVVAKIYTAEELYDTDKIVIEGQGSWTNEMTKFVTLDFPEASIEHCSTAKVEVYLPVKPEGIISSSPWTDVLADLSVFVVCTYLLYYILSQ